MPRDVALFFPPSKELPDLGDEAALRRAAARKLGVQVEALSTVRALRVSFDARARTRGWRFFLRAFEPGEAVPDDPPRTPPTYQRPREDADHVVVIGSGPAGLFCALDLLAAGLRVTVLERGRDVRARRKPLQRLNRGSGVDPDCNYCFGEGGAGTYSDGKLYARSGRKRDVREVLDTLVAHGAPPEIQVSWRPHIGSNRLPEVVRALRDTLLRSGGAVRFGSRAEEITTELVGEERCVRSVVLRDLDDGTCQSLACDAVVLATGHSALDSVRMAARAGARLEPKGFAMGVRIEHPQPWLDERQYGGLRDVYELPAAFYELTTQADGRGVYSFCMCPGGFIVPTTTDADRVVVNGMSLSRRDSPYANSGLVVSIEPEDWCRAAGADWGWDELLGQARAHGAEFQPRSSRELPERPADDPLFGVRLQLALETVAAHAGGGSGRAPAQRADDFAEEGAARAPLRPTSFRPGLAPFDLRRVLPPGLHRRLLQGVRDFEAHLPGYSSELGQLIGVESRTSSPVRIARHPETLESEEVEGLYPCGEGAGYAGGIVSAAIDGKRVAASLARTRG